MHVSSPRNAGKSVDVKGCTTRIWVRHPLVAEKKVLDGRSQWFSHVR
ncbi:MAG TPA: hypothetical protein VLC79_13640 [Cellvibrio sp.]|nr:hypothetical protein [Cellvibrio sp.]